MKALLISLLMLFTVGCSSKKNIINKGEYYINNQFTASGQNERIRFLIFHYTASDYTESLEKLTKGQVSAHYLLPQHPQTKNNKPIILQLVPEQKRAWHAGVSYWQGRNNINDTSIGIEIVNKGFTEQSDGRFWYPYTESQINALTALAKDIIKRNHIPPENILGHSDIAPLRKQDPGWLFPWKRLSQVGIGAWPDEATVTRYLAGRAPNSPASVLEIQQTLQLYGYSEIPQSAILDNETRQTIRAFQMHFRPANISGNPDAETEAIAKALVEKYRNNKI
nr:N-acetylmuramoyl-L-alanine amidase [uncultured Moellerella sp.]